MGSLRGVGAGIKMERRLVPVLVLIVAAVATFSQGVTLQDTYNEDDLFYHGGLPLPTSDDGDPGKIFNGQNAKENFYPFVVFLGIPNIAHICTGSLLSGKWVLTAAHCTYRGATHVFAGVYDRSEPLADDEQYPIAEIIRHPNYTVFSNDVALVKLSYPVNLTSPAASKVALVKSDKYMSQVLDNKKKCRVLGWAAELTPTRGWKATNTLQLLKLKFVSEAETLSRGYICPFFEGTMNVEALEYEDQCEYGSTC